MSLHAPSRLITSITGDNAGETVRWACDGLWMSVAVVFISCSSTFCSTLEKDICFRAQWQHITVERALGWESQDLEGYCHLHLSLTLRWPCLLSVFCFPYLKVKGHGLDDWSSSGLCHFGGSVIHLHAHPTHSISSLSCSQTCCHRKAVSTPPLSSRFPELNGLSKDHLKRVSNNFWKWLAMLGWLTEFNLKEQTV